MCRCQYLLARVRASKSFLAQMDGFCGAGVETGEGFAPLEGVEARFVVQVPRQKPHLRQRQIPPAPAGLHLSRTIDVCAPATLQYLPRYKCTLLRRRLIHWIGLFQEGVYRLSWQPLPVSVRSNGQVVRSLSGRNGRCREGAGLSFPMTGQGVGT